MMHKLPILLALILVSFCATAQVIDDFSDGDFTNNPTWQGKTPRFKVSTSDQLQTQGSGTDTAYLVTPSTTALNAEWTFWAKQSFNSSKNNHGRIYLISSEANVSDSTRGYFLEFGNTEDILRLVRQDVYDTIHILHGTQLSTGSSVNAFSFKITRSASGLWEVMADPNGGTAYVSEGTILDNTYTQSSYFGVFCKHTSSNAGKFYYDDFYVGDIVVDTIPPSLNAINLIDATHIELQFSEALAVSAVNTANYSVDNGVGTPSTAQLKAGNASVVELSFAIPFPSGVLLELQAQNMEDLAGNQVALLTEQFAFYQVQPFDVLINELMADPSPVVGLPDVEYLELYNNTDFPIDLDGWTLRIGTTDKAIGSYTLAPHSYVILADDASEQDLLPYGDVVVFSSFSLSNGGADLLLMNPLGTAIHYLSYDMSWYQNELKENGGWSLEMMDVLNPCGCENNWSASEDSRGGTPGAVNAVATTNPDARYPEITRLSVISPLQIKLYFSEPMDSNTVLDLNAYTVDQGMGSPTKITGNYPFYDEVILQLSSVIQPSVRYALSLQDSLKDCVGLYVDLSTNMPFGLPEEPVKGDVVINEILFNPKDDGVDFVELYNKSDKIVDLRFLALANWDEDLMAVENMKQITEESWMLFPGSYALLSTDGAKVRRQYFSKDESVFLDMSGFISMSNEDGEVLLTNMSEQIFDRVDYHEEMHYDLLVSVDGVSLEKMNFEMASEQERSWHSAAETVGFATPGYLNSQFSIAENGGGRIEISPKVFSPDNDGRDDVASIILNVDESAQSCTIRIYDSRGRIVRNLETNAYIGTENTFTWDGITEQGSKAGMGIYVIYVEVYNDKGDMQQYKEVLTLGGRL